MKNNNDGEIKNLAKMAKKRLQTGFWEDYRENVRQKIEIAQSEGIQKSNVIDYYRVKAQKQLVKTKQEDDSFYYKVKEILDQFGEVSDMIGRLCDKAAMQLMTFEQKQRYIFDLSEQYLVCRERYYNDKKYSFAQPCDVAN